MSRSSIDCVLRHIADTQLPVVAADHSVLIEFATSVGETAFGLSDAALDGVLGEALEAGEIMGAALSRGEAQRLAFGHLRDEHAEAQSVPALRSKTIYPCRFPLCRFYCAMLRRPALRDRRVSASCPSAISATATSIST
jgi:hypothetical protein